MSAWNGTLWDHSGIALGSLGDKFRFASGVQIFLIMFHDVAGKLFNINGTLWDHWWIALTSLRDHFWIAPVIHIFISGLQFLETKARQHFTRCGWEAFQQTIEHSGITPGLLWDRFGITVGLLPAYRFLVGPRISEHQSFLSGQFFTICSPYRWR